MNQGEPGPSAFDLPNMSLEVATKVHFRNPAVSRAGVLLVHSAKLRGTGGLLSKHGTGDRHYIFFTVVSVFQKRWAPRVATNSSSGNEDSSSC